MKEICVVQVGQTLKLGFTNQIGRMINGIIEASLTGKKIVLIDQFNQHYDQANYCPISQIIDLPALDQITRQLGVHLYDLTQVKLKLVSAYFGIRQTRLHRFMDVTEYFQRQIAETGHLSKDVKLNEIKGDPFPNCRKKIYLTYQIGEQTYTTIYDEMLTGHIAFDPAQMTTLDCSWINESFLDLYVALIKAVKFAPDFVQRADQQWLKIQNSLTPELTAAPINVLHLRDEASDALPHFAQLNRTNQEHFHQMLVEKYLGVINKYLAKNQLTIVLTGSQLMDSRVLQYMQNQGFPFVLSSKEFAQRELNALIDLLLSERGNNVFIGSCHPFTIYGSSFSFLMWKRNSQFRQHVFLELENIRAPELVLGPEQAKALKFWPAQF